MHDEHRQPEVPQAGQRALLGLELGQHTVAFVGAIAICLMWWRGLDEAAREAHKWAWWWGGTTGTTGTAVSALIMLGLLALSGADGALIGPFAAMSPVAIMQTAVLGVLGFQVVGYGVAWGVWWLARR